MALIDTTQCENEPIRFPGAAMPHGALLVVSPAARTIEAVSESCLEVLGLHPDRLIGRPLDEVLEPSVAGDLLAEASSGERPVSALSLDGRALAGRARENALGLVLVEIEPESDLGGQEEMLYALRRGLDRLRSLSDLEAICRAAAELIRDVTGYDRVMTYRFDAAWNGEVLAEARAPDVKAYLGLNYPASDIPKQARDLFQNSGVRMIVDVDYTPSPLIGSGEPRSIDLGASSLRNVSPIHIQYLKNMGVRATLVGSLVCDGRLWGLLSCQHEIGPKYFGPALRDALGWACQDIATLIGAAETRTLRAREHELAALRQTLVEKIRATDFRTQIREGDPEILQGVVGADGFALLIRDQVHACGVTPSGDRILRLQRLREERASTPTFFFASNALERDLGGGSDDGIAGALFVSAPRFPEVTMIWFRRERRYTVRWSGDPDRPHLAAADGRLTPRTSFEQFLQDIAGTALEWTAEEQASARELGSLIEIELLRKERAFSRTVLDSSPDSMTILDGQGRIVDTNSAWNEFATENGAPELAQCSVGMAYATACGVGEEDIDRDEAAAAKAGIDAVMSGTRDFFSLDYPCHSPSRRRWFRMRVYPMRAPAEGVVIAHQDITEGKVLELQLRQSLRRFDALYRSGLVGVMSSSLDGRVKDANDRLLQMLGYGREELEAGQINWRTMTPPEFAERTDRSLRELRSFGFIRRPYEKEFIRKDGTRLPVFIAIIMLDESDSVAFILDRTEQKKAAELSQSLHAQRIELMKGMAAGLAHELNQPLTATQSFLGSARALLGLPPDRRPVSVEAALGDAADNLARAGQILVRLREFIAHSEPDKSFVRLHDLIRESVEIVSATAKQRGIDVTLRLRAAEDEVIADPVQIGQVLVNLLKNAQESIRESVHEAVREEKKASIVVSTSSTAQHIQVEVADTGAGISDAVSARLFEPFVTSKAKGMGVGLVISRAIVEAHDGQLSARSNERGGATFGFTLPLASEP